MPANQFCSRHSFEVSSTGRQIIDQRRRRCRFSVHHLLRDKHASFHDRASVSGPGLHQDTSLSQQPAALSVPGERDLAKSVAFDSWYAVVPGHGAIDEYKVRIDQVVQRQVLVDYMRHELDGFFFHRTFYRDIKIAKEILIDSDQVLAFQFQPLIAEVREESIEPFVVHHSFHLLASDCRVHQLSAMSQLNEFGIRCGPPQEI